MATAHSYFDYCYVDQVQLDAAGNPTGEHSLYGLIMSNPLPWVANETVAAGVYCLANGNAYLCTQGGATASSGGPTGTGTGITDSTAKWNYYQPANTNPSVGYWWWGMPESAFGSGGVAAGSSSPPLPIGPAYTAAQCQAAGMMPIKLNIGQVTSQSAAGTALNAQWSPDANSLVQQLQAQYPAIATGPAFIPTPFNNAMGTCSVTF
jgi:hypothetical protein